ncbi:SURF1 family-domain-containing protein [Limtongia smithiae]|uniref:SURF1 family-domain-containing protein n=1 Tax=Limtongia smithiae TaxID=1125753 RepID=UPI0034CD8F91
MQGAFVYSLSSRFTGTRFCISKSRRHAHLNMPSSLFTLGEGLLLRCSTYARLSPVYRIPTQSTQLPQRMFSQLRRGVQARRCAPVTGPQHLSSRQFSGSSCRQKIDMTTDWEAMKSKEKPTMRRVTILSLLLLMPIISFGLGAWQVKRLKWKTDLIAEYENRLILPPMLLPKEVNPDAAASLQYRRVIAKGRFRYDQEILVGPRTNDGETGYAVITPFENENGSKILVNRGWIKKDMADQHKRAPEALPEGIVYIEGLIKTPPGPNYFTPANEPNRGLFYFIDVQEFARMTDSLPIMVEELGTKYAESDSFISWEVLIDAGIPLGRLPKVDLRNNHSQYIVTWIGLGIATTVMFIIMLRAPKTDKAKKLKHIKYYS